MDPGDELVAVRLERDKLQRDLATLALVLKQTRANAVLVAASERGAKLARDNIAADAKHARQKLFDLGLLLEPLPRLLRQIEHFPGDVAALEEARRLIDDAEKVLHDDAADTDPKIGPPVPFPLAPSVMPPKK
jgi:hypothetical protein